MIAKVSIDKKTSSITNVYDYNVPASLVENVSIGTSVFVPFGYDQVFGYVVEVVKEDKDGLKDIIDVVSASNQIGDINFKLATILSKDLNCTMANILGMMQPSFLKGQKQQYLYINDYDSLDASIAVALNGKEKVLITSALDPFKKQIANEIKKGNIDKGYEYYVYGKNKKVKVYSVIDGSIQPTKARTLVVSYLMEHPASTLEDIKIATNVGSSVVKTLLKNHILKVEEIIESRSVTGEKKNISRYEFSFSEQEQIDYYQLSSSKPFLLFSNNQEFDTNFMLKLIFNNLEKNQKTIIIYPNALSIEEAYINLKRNSRNLDIITYHSRNTNSDNYDAFNKILDNYDLLIGTPQAILLPIKNIGDMILNDTDDEMYINETYPYINYKEAAIKKASLLNAKVVLASASPSISDYYKASTGVYNLLTIHSNEKVDAKIVDMNTELLETNDLIISNDLNNKILSALERQKISLLICNNVAFATQIKCRKCGKVLKCPKCGVTLSYIKSKDIAKCNYCNYEEKMFRTCKCGSTNFISLGFGLERVEERVKSLYKDARVIKVDSTYLNSKEKMENLIQMIEESSVDIIVGTNALTKLAKYDNMEVVGLLYVDSYLNMNNYLGAEYTYNLIARVANYPSMVIQTYYPTHYAITSGVNNNYEDYYEAEIKNRELLDYPPFKEFSMILLKGEYSELFHFAYYFKKAISHNELVSVLGPIYDYHYKGVKLIIKHHDNDGVIKIMNDVIKHFDNPKIMCSYHRYTRGG